MLDVRALQAAAEGHLFRSGRYSSVSRHEPKRAPEKGLTAAIWLMSARPIPARSGLASTTARVELRVRLYTPMLREPMDAIDPQMLEVIDLLMADYSGSFTLGGLVAFVDLLGAHGPPLDATTGYLQVGQTMFRVADITLPLVVNDLWVQAP